MKNKYIHSVFEVICLILIALTFGQCEPKIEELEKSSEDYVIADYVSMNPDFKEFAGLLKHSNLNSLLKIRGPYTLFLPTDSAMKVYYKQINVSSYSEIDTVLAKNIVLNHIVGQQFGIADFKLGTLDEKNALGDNIVVEFIGPEIFINKESRIVKRDIKISNGRIHSINKVIIPLTDSDNVYALLSRNPAYSIFAEGLKRTGLNDTLSRIRFDYGKSVARNRYTILAIADTTFKDKFGINSIDELISKYTNAPDSIKIPGNGFYNYMDFHCLDKAAYYFSNFEVKPTLYTVLSKNNNVQIRFENEIFKINVNLDDKTFTGFYANQSNIPAKNGVIHTIDGLLEVSDPAPTAILWEVTDFFDLKQGEYYLRHFEKFFDPNQFKGIYWEGDYLQYYIKTSDAPVQTNYDCLNMLGWWTLEVTTPKIMRGNYSLNLRIWEGRAYTVYIDGEPVWTVKSSDKGTEKGLDKNDPNLLLKVAEVSWPTTIAHKIKIVALESGSVFWDRVEFIPITAK